MRIYLSFLVISTTILFISCNDSTTIGGDIVGIDDLDTKVTKEVPIEAKTIKPDATTGYITDNVYNRHFLGRLQDPIFGESRARINAQFLLDNFSTEFNNPEVDSVVLAIEYDSTGVRGQLGDIEMDVEVLRIDERLSNLTSYDTDLEVNTLPTPIGELNDYTPRISDSVTIDYPVNEEIESRDLPPHMRIKLDQSFGEELLSYSSDAYESNNALLSKFFGLQINADVENTMLAANLRSRTSVTSLDVYYKEDTIPKVYSLKVTDVAVALNHYNHDYSGSPVGDFINNTVRGDSLLYVQGFSGVEIEVKLPDLSQFDDKIINFAELKMYYADIEDGAPFTGDIDVLTATYEEDEEFSLVPDASNAESAFSQSGRISDIREIFGGYSQESDSVKFVNFKIPIHLQNMISGNSISSFRLRPRSKATTADRSIFYGPKHSEYPMSLKIVYTEQN